MTPLTDDEVAGLVHDNAQEDGIYEMMMDATEELVTDEGIFTFEAI